TTRSFGRGVVRAAQDSGMNKTRHCCVACILAGLIGFLLPWQLMGESATAPSNYRFQTRLDAQPQNDRFTVRVINASSEAQLIDMRTAHYHNIWFRAEKKREKPERQDGTIEVPEPVLTTVGAYTRSGDNICSAPETIAGDIVTNNAVSLMPSAYIGIYRRSAELVIFEPLKSAVYEAKSDEFWNLEYPLSAELPGPDGRPVRDRCMLSVKPARVTRDMIEKILAARARADLEEKKTVSEESPKDMDRFRLCLSLAPDMDALMADVVCVHPEPGKNERRMWFPQRRIHMKTLSDASWQWQVKAGERLLYESRQTDTTDQTDYSKPGNCPRLGKGQLVGRTVPFSKSPMFPAVQKFFAETKSKTATCAVRLKLKLYVPAEDGNPREAGDLVSDSAVVAAEDYWRIRKSALAGAQEEEKPAAAPSVQRDEQ
ncbi:MAG: hypothetical protein QME60_08210, partial [Verrucomicrobiota bacterium]|nr:hypothetical protein [Verrucomicrobiota bacterium]